MPILPLLGLGMGLAKPVEMVIMGDMPGALAEAGARFTGYNYQSKQFDAMYALMNGWLPFLAGVGGHMVAQKLGVNRYMRKIPVIGKWVGL